VNKQAYISGYMEKAGTSRWRTDEILPFVSKVVGTSRETPFHRFELLLRAKENLGLPDELGGVAKFMANKPWSSNLIDPLQDRVYANSHPEYINKRHILGGFTSKDAPDFGKALEHNPPKKLYRGHTHYNPLQTTPLRTVVHATPIPSLAQTYGNIPVQMRYNDPSNSPSSYSYLSEFKAHPSNLYFQDYGADRGKGGLPLKSIITRLSNPQKGPQVMLSDMLYETPLIDKNKLLKTYVIRHSKNSIMHTPATLDIKRVLEGNLRPIRGSIVNNPVIQAVRTSPIARNVIAPNVTAAGKAALETTGIPDLVRTAREVPHQLRYGVPLARDAVMNAGRTMWNSAAPYAQSIKNTVSNIPAATSAALATGATAAKVYGGAAMTAAAPFVAPAAAIAGVAAGGTGLGYGAAKGLDKMTKGRYSDWLSNMMLMGRYNKLLRSGK